MRNVITQEGPDLEDEMYNDNEIVALCADYEIAKQFYAGMCNITWKKLKAIPDDERLVETLKGTEYCSYLCSWRSAGGIIANIRNMSLGMKEDYMDFYCSGGEGSASELVLTNFGRLGWTPDESDVS